MSTSTGQDISIFDIDAKDILNVDEIILNKEQKAASMYFYRFRPRFIDTDLREEIITLCNKFFGDKNVNEENGLIVQYTEMKKFVIDNEMIGLVLCGVNYKDILINNYTRVNLTCVQLTVSSITRTLLREFFSSSQLDELCRSAPKFETYYTTE